MQAFWQHVKDAHAYAVAKIAEYPMATLWVFVVLFVIAVVL